MEKSPFKFLDSYNKDDQDIFFGRERETEELYQKVFESKILLVYGITGTGKTSLINCGLANKFNESDWLPIYVRRNQDIIQSIIDKLSEFSYDNTKASNNKESILKLIQSVYLDNFKPIYLLFDQFEELFIFGNKDERKAFIELIDAINQSDIQCKCLFILREEFLANITEFEKTIPEFFQNRIRIEKMSPVKAIETIKGPCNAVGIEIKDEVAEDILHKVSKDESSIELTYLQVLLDKIYQSAVAESKDGISITQEIVNKIGDVEDILGDFLEQQIRTFENSDDILHILKSFVSVHGTKKQVSPEEINDHLKTFDQEIDQEQLPIILQDLVSKRILNEKDDHGRYELIHDALAAKIYEKITLVEKEILEVRQFIENAYVNFEKRNVLLNDEDLKYISPYEDKMFLGLQLKEFIEKSKEKHERFARRKKRIILLSVSLIIVCIFCFLIYSVYKQKREKERLELILENAAVLVNPEKMNVLYIGIDNPLNIRIPGIRCEDIYPEIDQGRLMKIDENCKYVANPQKEGIANIRVKGRVWENKEIRYIGKPVKFRVKALPNPLIKVCGQSGGVITLQQLIENPVIDANLDIDFDLGFKTKSFAISTIINEVLKEVHSKNNKISDEQFELLKSLKDSAQIFFTDVKAIGPDGSTRILEGASFTILTDIE